MLEIIIKIIKSDHLPYSKKTILKYRPEEAQELKIERLSQYKRLNYLENDDMFYLNWNTEYDYECSPEEKAKEIILSNKSIHIDGRAGTGKTFITNKIIDELKEQGKKYLAFSPIILLKFSIYHPCQHQFVQ